MAGAGGKSWSPWSWEINDQHLTSFWHNSNSDRSEQVNSKSHPIWNVQSASEQRKCRNIDSKYDFPFNFSSTMNSIKELQVPLSEEPFERPCVSFGLWLDNRENQVSIDVEKQNKCQDCDAVAILKLKCRACRQTLCSGCLRAHWREKCDRGNAQFMNKAKTPRSSREERNQVRTRVPVSEARCNPDTCNTKPNDGLNSLRVCSEKPSLLVTCDRQRRSFGSNVVSREPFKIDLQGKTHDSESLIFCQTCSDIACHFCIAIDHNGHNLCHLPESMSHAMITSVKLLEVARNGAESSVLSISTATQWQESMLIEYGVIESKIKQLMNEFRFYLDRRERELMSALRASLTLQSESVMNEISTFKTLSSTFSEISRILADVVERVDPADIFQVVTVCSQQIARAKDVQERAVFPRSTMGFVYPDAGLLPSISKMGRVTLVEQKPYGSIGNSGASSLVTPPSLSSPAAATPAAEKNPSNIDHGPFVGRLYSGVYRKFGYSRVGKPTLIFGRNGGDVGEFRWPWGICCSADGNIIVADRCNHRVQIFNKQGKFLRQFGEYGKVEAGSFDRPAGVALGRSGQIIVTDKDNHRVQVFSPQGQFLFKFGREGSSDGEFSYPWGVAVNANGEILVSDSKNFRVQMFTDDGIFLNKFSILRENDKCRRFSPRGICLDPKGNIFVADFNNHRILVVDPDFQTYRTIGEPGTSYKQLLRPQGVAVDDQGNLVISDSKNDRIQVFTTGGTYIFQFGSHGTNEGQFDRPSGVCFTPDGRTVVVDFKNNRVQLF